MADVLDTKTIDELKILLDNVKEHDRPEWFFECSYETLVGTKTPYVVYLVEAEVGDDLYHVYAADCTRLLARARAKHYLRNDPKLTGKIKTKDLLASHFAEEVGIIRHEKR